MYLLTLLLAIAALWLLHKTSEDIYTILAGGSAGILLIWGLALAPWFIQLGSVILVLSLEQMYFIKTD